MFGNNMLYSTSVLEESKLLKYMKEKKEDLVHAGVIVKGRHST